MKFNFLSVLIFSISLILSAAQSPAQTAERLYKAGALEQAVTEYLRATMMDQENPGNFLRAGEILRELGNFKDSNTYLERAMFLENERTQREEIRLMIGSNHLLAGNYVAAELVIERLSDETVERHCEMINIMRILILISTNREKEALETAASAEKRAGIKALSGEVMKLSRLKISPSKATFMSTILPGSGQLRAGDSKNAANAVLLNGTIFYLWGSLLIDQNFTDFFYYLITFKRYYNGQREKAGIIAQERNEQLNSMIRSTFMEYLKRNYQGL